MAPHLYWRVLITATNGSANTNIAEAEMRATAGGADQCTGGTASQSSFFAAPYMGSAAFDNNNATMWVGTAIPAWVQYQFASPVTVVEYTIRVRSDGFPTEAPRNWTLQGSDDGATWVPYDIRTAHTGWASSEVRTFTAVPPPIGVAHLAQASVEALRRGARAQVAHLSVETLRNPGLTHMAQVSVEELSGSLHTRLAHVSVEVLWFDRPVEGPGCEPLPEWIAYGATGGPEWSTALFSAPGGWEQRTQLWTHVRGRWDVAFLNRTRAEIDTLVAFFRAVAQGKARSFCFTDWRDHTFDNVIGTGDGTTSAFQLVKVYTSGSLSYARPLSRVVLGSLVVTVNGVPTTHYAVEATTGQIQFSTTPPSGAVIAASGEFEVLVRFETDSLQITCVAPGLFSCAGLGLVELIGE